MKRVFIFLLFGLFIPQLAQAQGAITYLSNLGQPASGSLSIGSDSWVAAMVSTGTNAGGYILDSVQLAMATASGSPNGLTVMLYNEGGNGLAILPGSSLNTLTGSASPMANGTYNYIAPANLTLSANGTYFIVVTGGTTVANGAFNWSSVNSASYNSTGDWGKFSGTWTSVNGSSWNESVGTFPEFALNATAAPEPGTMSLLGLGGLLFGLCRRKKS